LPEEVANTVDTAWTTDALSQLRLPKAMTLESREHRTACMLILEDAGVSSAADLAAMSFVDFMRPDEGVAFRTFYVGKVIEFMIARGICFSDLDPRETFKTGISLDDPLIDVRTYNCLMRGGLLWVEILPYFTAEALGKIRNFGAKSLLRVNAILEGQGLSLRETDEQ
jgi:hypothetical protein